ncbi:MAG: glycosyl hydrolase [Acidobacteria bacterium]|nr:glycosyl hydrolase [Acidobacteriota bacterium]
MNAGLACAARRAGASGLLVLSLLGLSCARPPATEGTTRPAEERDPERPDRAWFIGQRMSSGEPIPAQARERALARWKRSHDRGAGGASAGITLATAAAGVWTFAGPTNIGGRLTSLAVDPTDPNHIWAGAAAGGVVESTDQGATWTPVFDGQPLLPVGAVAAHPTSPNIVYVGTGEANGAGYSYDGDGVYRTADGGATWQPMGLADTHRIGRIAIDPVDPQRIFVAAAGGVYVPDTHRGVYRSLDGGVSWTQVLFVAPTAGAIDVAIDPGNPVRIYAAIWEHYSTPTHWIAGGVNSGIWQSVDGGDTWARLANGLPAPSGSVGRIGLAIAASSPQTVYALYLNDPGALMGVYRTADAGSSWGRVDTPGSPPQSIFGGAGYYFGQIRVDPADAQVVYVLDVYWSRSTNGGATWTNFVSGLHVDNHDLAILPGRLYMATDGGFYRSADGGGTWTQAASLPVSQFYDLGIDPSNTLARYGGLQDNGSVRTKTGGLSNWAMVNGGDGLQCEVDPLDSKRVYCESQFGGIVRSTNGGNTFAGAVSGIATSDRRNWNAPITHDPSTSQRLYTGTTRVYRSTNGAQSWAAISGDLTNGPPALASQARGGAPASSHLASTVAGTITTIAVSRIDSNILWAGTDDGNVWVTTNAGALWTQIDVPGRSEWVTRLEADPFATGGAFVTFSGYRDGSPLPRIFRTSDYGAAWADISGGLPDVPLNCVSADPAADDRGRIFVCSDLGVEVSDDFGGRWSMLGSGLPGVVVHDLDLIASTRELFAGTHARGMYRFDLTQLGPADADGDGSNNLTDCRPSDPGVFAAPGEVTGLAFAADRITLGWNSAAPAAGSATVHQVLRGGVTGLPVGGAGESCLSTGTVATSLADSAVPPGGMAFWYLVRAENACGAGGYGLTSAGSPRASGACP